MASAEVELPLQHCGPVPDCLVPRESSGETHPHAPPSSPPAAPGTGTQGEAESPWFSSIVISPPACSCSSSLSQHVPAPAGSPRSTLPRAKTSATTHSPSQPATHSPPPPPPGPAPTPSSETPSSAPSLRFLHDADGCPGAAELDALPVDFSMHMYCFTYGLLVYDGRSVVVASSLAHIYCQHCQRRREGVRQNAQEGRGRVDRGLLVHAEWGMRGGIALSGVVEIVRQAHGRWRGQIHGPRVAWRRARCRLNLSIEVKTVVPVGA
ncbi:LOW QUALITY PROTEIN: hypothetical protein GQ55_9G485600 [Panicum hallii var. hallii]|uniref:Uncharacterized protein n=1 Tax=Panicum hallii var. hallii TaxID=1504633 RepID=A0A2T7CD06_9POAL|nr:LOW QUALITY PROTEIN: hypothetical protein GQ55_9G485600 [Panicum hallii var. hallii]